MSFKDPNNKLKRHFEELLNNREQDGTLRKLKGDLSLIDFSSNDYLGLGRSTFVGNESNILRPGGTGSRLLTGNHSALEDFEDFCCEWFDSESALLFSTGYMANLGIIPALSEAGDCLHYDSKIHASTRDGILLSRGKRMKFHHNDLADLENNLKIGHGNQFVFVESLYSMDGDFGRLKEINVLCKNYGAYLVVDEAHTTGIVGAKGAGLSKELGIHKDLLVRIFTFGKAAGRQGAIVTGPGIIREYLINYCKTFIFSTAPSPQEVSCLFTACEKLISMEEERANLWSNRNYFVEGLRNIPFFADQQLGESPIIPLQISGAKEVKNISSIIQEKGFDVRPIVSPTVKVGEERLRVIIHSFNTQEQMQKLLKLLEVIL